MSHESLPANSKLAWYDNKIVILASLPLSIFCAFMPLGLLPLWLSTCFDKRAKIALTIALPLPFLLLIVAAVFADTTEAVHIKTESNPKLPGRAGYFIKRTDKSQPGKTILEIEIQYVDGIAPSPEQLATLADELHGTSSTPRSTFIFFFAARHSWRWNSACHLPLQSKKEI